MDNTIQRADNKGILLSRESFGTRKLSKKEKIKFAYVLWKKQRSYDEAHVLLDIGRKTYARWVQSFKRKGLRRTLREFGKWKSGVPANKTPEKVKQLVIKKRKADGYGRVKAKHILKRDYGITISERTITRIINLKGVKDKVKHYPHKKSSYEHMVPYYPGELVQADPMQVGDLFICNFCDWITRMRFSCVMDAQTMQEAKRCIALAIAYFPFKIQRLQWDNGSEAQHETEQFVLDVIGASLNHIPPHTPKLNGLVERLNKTTREEEVGYRQFKKNERKILENILEEGVWKYNFYRPHLSLNLHTPMELWNSFVDSHDPIISTILK